MASINLVYEFAEHGELGVRIARRERIGELFGAIAPLAGGASPTAGRTARCTLQPWSSRCWRWRACFAASGRGTSEA
jgi:hypothetical protein